MELNKRVKKAEFEISETIIIRYVKNYGFYIDKEINKNWYTCTKKFRMNPFGIGFKLQYGFGFDDMKPFLFETFDEALKQINKVDKLPYWEYNQDTHTKVFDSILKKERYNSLTESIVNQLIREIK